MAMVVFKIEGSTALHGVVLANELSGPPMANVQVSTISANPNITDSNGEFLFVFPNRSPGDTVRLIAQKDGYVVVNEIQLEVTLPNNPDERPTIIILCKEGEREQWARRFYRLALVSSINEAYQKKFAAAQNASAVELARLRQQQEEGKYVAENLAEKLAKRGAKGAPQTYGTAAQLFLSGNVDQALLTLSTSAELGLDAAKTQGASPEPEQLLASKYDIGLIPIFLAIAACGIGIVVLVAFLKKRSESEP